MNGQVLNGTAITDTSLVDLCAFMNAASISNIPILLSAQSAGALVKAMTTSAPVQPVAVPGAIAKPACYVDKSTWPLTDENRFARVWRKEDAFDDAIPLFAAPAAQGDAVNLECCGSTEFCERAACPAQGDAKELTDDEIVQAVRSVGVDTHPSKFGFKEQIEGMSVPVLRQVIAAIAAKAAS